MDCGTGAALIPEQRVSLRVVFVLFFSEASEHIAEGDAERAERNGKICFLRKIISRGARRENEIFIERIGCIQPDASFFIVE